MIIADMLTYYDLLKLSKSQLINLASDLNLEEASNGSQISELAKAIFNSIKDSDRNRNIINKRNNCFFAGRGTVRWYKANSRAINDYIEYLKKEDKDKPFEKFKKDIDQDHIETSSPKLLGAIDIEDGTFLRFAARTGTISQPGLTENIVFPKIEIITLFINNERNLIEVRASSRIADNMINYISSFIENHDFSDESSALELFDLNEVDGDPVSYFVNELNGRDLENVDVPANIQDFSEEDREDLLSIIQTIDNRVLDNGKTNDINGIIDSAKSGVFGKYPKLTFLGLILIGLVKVNLGSNKELRDNLLYNSIQEYMITQTSYISFPCSVDGEKMNFTIRVGLTTSTIYFPSSSTEEAIALVRKALG